MSRLHDILIRRYSEHFERVNAGTGTDPRNFSPLAAREMELMYGALLSSLPDGSRVLDLGCGTGFLLRWLARQERITAVGVDQSESQVEILRRTLPGVEVALEDGLAYLRAHPATFGGIFCLDVLEHIAGDDGLLQWVEAAAAALQERGFFFCRMPNAANLASGYGRYMDLTHQRSFTAPSVIQLLEAAGFANCTIVPIRAAHWSGRVRLLMERILHRVVFRISGYGLERVFTNNVCAVGFNGREPRASGPGRPTTANGLVVARSGMHDSRRMRSAENRSPSR
jgi:2-polyprenyl-3-methyl-5-hydroxy-6-metoxy-1,4-benzoquinol methylase